MAPISRSRIVVAAATVVALSLLPRIAAAEEVSPTGKGLIGGALLGAEIPVFAEALFGVRSTLVYGVSAGAGAVSGAIAGYAVEQASEGGRGPTYLLAGGLALLIPAVVVTLNQTRYVPPETTSAPATQQEDSGPSAPPSEPAKAGNPSASRSANQDVAVRTPTSLIQWHESGVQIGVPVPEMRPALTAAQRNYLAASGATSAASEVRVSVVSMTF